MKERILRLCKRLDKFSFEDISTIAEDIEESVLKLLLLTLVNEKRLIQKNEVYFYNKTAKNKQFSLFQYFNKTIINLVIRCFCVQITADKTSLIVGISENSVYKFYTYFRKLLYDRQKAELLKLYSLNPQNSRLRTFFKQNAYFYIYNNQVYVTDKPLKSTKEKNFTKEEIQEFKKIYCYLSRVECHNKNKFNLYHKLAEALWRRNKGFEELHEDLNKLIA